MGGSGRKCANALMGACHIGILVPIRPQLTDWGLSIVAGQWTRPYGAAAPAITRPLSPSQFFLTPWWGRGLIWGLGNPS